MSPEIKIWQERVKESIGYQHDVPTSHAILMDCMLLEISDLRAALKTQEAYLSAVIRAGSAK